MDTNNASTPPVERGIHANPAPIRRRSSLLLQRYKSVGYAAPDPVVKVVPPSSCSSSPPKSVVIAREVSKKRRPRDCVAPPSPSLSTNPLKRLRRNASAEVLRRKYSAEKLKRKSSVERIRRTTSFERQRTQSTSSNPVASPPPPPFVLAACPQDADSLKLLSSLNWACTTLEVPAPPVAPGADTAAAADGSTSNTAAEGDRHRPVLLARQKAKAAAALYRGPPTCLVACARTVTINGKVYGTPKSAEEATAMLRAYGQQQPPLALLRRRSNAAASSDGASLSRGSSNSSGGSTDGSDGSDSRRNRRSRSRGGGGGGVVCVTAAVVVTHTGSNVSMEGSSVARLRFRPIPSNVVDILGRSRAALACPAALMLTDCPLLGAYMVGVEGGLHCARGVPLPLLHSFVTHLHKVPPVTAAPVTAAPVTAAPVTAAPVTAAPAISAAASTTGETKKMLAVPQTAQPPPSRSLSH